MEEILDLMLKLLSKQHGVSEDAAAELLFNKSEEGEVDKTKLKDNALKTLLAKDVERIGKVKDSVDKTKIFDEAFAKAQKEVLGKAERKLAKKYGIEGDDLKLDKLVDTIVAKQTKDKTGDLTDDNVKKHPAYLALERAKEAEVKTLAETHASELKKVQDGYKRTETLGTVKSEVLKHFDALNPVLSKDVKKATNQRNNFARMFEDFDYEIQEDKSILILSGEKRLEDAHGNPVKLESLVSTRASELYDFSKQSDKGGSGNSGGAGGGNVKVPTNEEEYNVAIFNANSVEERQQISDAYNASNE